VQTQVIAEGNTGKLLLRVIMEGSTEALVPPHQLRCLVAHVL